MSDNKNRRVLIIDDNRSIHDDFRKILSPAESTRSDRAETESALFGDVVRTNGPPRFEVDSAYQGQEGFLLVKKAAEQARPYAVAFVDVRMPPGWDGFETTQKIWEIDPDIQIVICTAYSDHSWSEMFERIGHRDGLLILKKPFDAVEASQLAYALTEKWSLLQQSRRKMEELERRVTERTRELQQTNIVLQTEVAEHKRAAAALRESEQRFAGAFEHAPIGVALVSPDGRWLKVNRALCALVGYSEAELLTQNFQEITHPADIEADMANARRMLAGDIRFYQMEKRYFHARGHLITVLLDVSLVRDDQNEPLYFVAQIQDITERKRLQAQCLQSQKMETVGKLAGGVAHEFNSILCAIIGRADLLRGELPANSGLSDHATAIIEAADRAAALTRQLLAYGRKQFLRSEVLDLNRIVRSMDRMLDHLMGVDVDTHIIPTLGLHAVKGDSGQIEQVIVNMAMNARDAMPNGGTLTLETSNVSLDQESVGRYPDLKPGDYVMLAITDTGAGMNDEVKARVFEPFFTTKEIGQGVGLGLSTSYGIIKQSGGHISCYSELQRGTTFKIYLPQVEQNARASRCRFVPQELPRGTETILLVEDDSGMREMTAVLLKRLGYTVWAAASGPEALSLKPKADMGQFDLLFTDVVMPRMSGQELADRVLAINPRTRVLFTSAYTENTIIRQGILNDGVILLEKPFTPSALAHKLREVLAPSSAPKPAAMQSSFT